MTEVVEHLQHGPDGELSSGDQDQEVADAMNPLGITEKRIMRIYSHEFDTRLLT